MQRITGQGVVISTKGEVHRFQINSLEGDAIPQVITGQREVISPKGEV